MLFEGQSEKIGMKIHVHYDDGVLYDPVGESVNY